MDGVRHGMEWDSSLRQNFLHGDFEFLAIQGNTLLFASQPDRRSRTSSSFMPLMIPGGMSDVDEALRLLSSVISTWVILTSVILTSVM